MRAEYKICCDTLKSFGDYVKKVRMLKSYNVDPMHPLGSL
jgi:hypothetical protein